MARPELTDITLCPCNCGGISLKGLARSGHIPGCGLARTGATKPCQTGACTGRRNKRKGQRAQARTHRALGGVGFTPSNEESARAYELRVMPEVKTGAQIPRNWDRFIQGEWFRRAMNQSERAVPVGSGVRPSLCIRGDWLVVDLRGGGRND